MPELSILKTDDGRLRVLLTARLASAMLRRLG
jgi:hypothetical protein